MNKEEINKKLLNHLDNLRFDDAKELVEKFIQEEKLEKRLLKKVERTTWKIRERTNKGEINFSEEDLFIIKILLISEWIHSEKAERVLKKALGDTIQYLVTQNKSELREITLEDAGDMYFRAGVLLIKRKGQTRFDGANALEKAGNAFFETGNKKKAKEAFTEAMKTYDRLFSSNFTFSRSCKPGRERCNHFISRC